MWRRIGSRWHQLIMQQQQPVRRDNRRSDSSQYVKPLASAVAAPTTSPTKEPIDFADIPAARKLPFFGTTLDIVAAGSAKK